MAKSNKPVVWGLFAAGGTVTALLLPALVLLTLLPGVGLHPARLSYDGVHGLASGWPGKLAIFAFVFLALWHAAHRLRITVHDLGLRADRQVAATVYGAAAAGSLAAIYLLLRI